MLKQKFISIFIIVLFSISGFGQIGTQISNERLPLITTTPRKTQWQTAGCLDNITQNNIQITQYINVKNLGAIGDGTNDDTDMIIAAMSAANTGFTVLYFPPGTYKITQTLYIPSNIILKGESSETTILYFEISENDYIKMYNKEYVGIEDLKITRPDQILGSSSDRGTYLKIDQCSNCWIRGVETDNAALHHIEILSSDHIEIRDCFIHRAHSYDGGGNGYGILLSPGTSHCLIENNIFRSLRHSMIQGGDGHYNVWGYNASFNPIHDDYVYLGKNWVTGDMCLHGWSDSDSPGPYHNLFEGNIGNFIMVDAVWGTNGEYNTFFRNKAGKVGIKIETEHSGSGNADWNKNQNIVNNFLVCDDWAISNIGYGWDVDGKNHLKRNNYVKEKDFFGGWNTSWHDKDSDWYNDISYYHTQKPEFMNGFTWPLNPRYDSNAAYSRYNSSQVRTITADFQDYSKQYSGNVQINGGPGILSQIQIKFINRNTSEETIIFPDNSGNYSKVFQYEDFGTYDIEYSLENYKTRTTSITISINNYFNFQNITVNQIPFQFDLPTEIEFNEGDSSIIDLNNYITDGDLYNLSASSSGNSSVGVKVQELNVKFKADHNWFGEEQIIFLITESSDRYSATDTINISILPVNDPPNFQSLPDTSFLEDSSLKLSKIFFHDYFDDVDNPDNTLEVNFTGSGSIFIHKDQDSIIFFTSSNWFGLDTLQAIVNDGELFDTTSFVITVQPVNDPPVINSSDNISIQEKSRLIYHALAEDIDNSTLTYIFHNYPKWLTASTDSIFGIPNNESKDTSFLLIANDGELSDSLEVQVTVIPINDPPVISNLPDTSFNEDTILTIPNSYFYNYYEDPDNPDASLNFIIKNENNLLINTSNDSIHISSKLNWFGKDTLTALVSDNEFSDSSTFLITVNPLNDPPQFINLPDTSFDEDSDITLPLSYFAQYYSDPDNPDSTLNFLIKNENKVILTQDSTLYNFSSPANWFGTDTLTAIIRDTEFSDTTYFIMKVNPVNDPPKITSASSSIAYEDNRYIYHTTVKDLDNLSHNYEFIDIPQWLTADADSIFGTPLENMIDTSFTIIVNDDELFDTLKVFIDVVPINDPPVFTDTPDINFQEDTIITFDPLYFAGYYSDPDNPDSTLNFLIKDENEIKISMIEDSYQFSSPTNWYGTDTLTAIVSDEEFSDTVSFLIIVTPVNDPPIVTSSDNTEAYEDSRFVYLATANDIDNISLNYDFQNYPDWLTASTDSIFGTPLENMVDTSFTIIVNDGQLFDTLKVFIDVIPVNDPPKFSGFPNLNFDEDSNKTVSTSFFSEYYNDEDNPDSTLSFSIINQNQIILSQFEDSYLFTSPENWFGSDTLTAIISDDEFSDTTSFIVTVNPINDPPNITSSKNTQAFEDSKFVYLAIANDIDNISLNYDFQNFPDWLIPSADSISGTPLENMVDTSFTIIVNDGQLFDTLKVFIDIIPVNDPPQISNIPNINFDEDTYLTFPKSYFAEYYSDPDNPDSTLNFLIKDENEIEILMIEDSYQFSSPVNWSGIDTLSAIISDEEYSDTVSFLIIVTPVNDPPMMTSSDKTEAFEDSRFVYHAIANDIDNISLNYEFQNYPGWLIALADSIFGTPLENMVDTSFTIIVDDGQLFDTLKVFIDVIPVNDPPQISNIPNINFDEDSYLTFPKSYFAEYYSDPDNPDSTLEFLLQDENKIMISEIIDSIHFASQLNWFGIDTLSAIVKDIELADTSSLIITVNPVNDAPKITSNINVQAFEDMKFIYKAKANDIDNATLFYEFENLPQWINSSQDSLYGYPIENTADTSFTLIANDGQLFDTLKIFIDVIPVNDPPVISDLPDTNFNEDSDLMIPINYYSEYYYDSDNPDSTLKFTAMSGNHITVVINNDFVVLISDPDWFGADTLTAIVHDSEYSDSIKYIVTVNPVNDAPKIISDMQTQVFEDIRFIYNAMAVDIDNPQLFFQFKNHPAWMFASADSIFGIPYEGTKDTSFSIIVNDGELYDSVSVFVDVIPVNDPPYISELPTLNFPEDSSRTYPESYFAEYYSDPDNPDSTLTFVIKNESDILIFSGPDSIKFSSSSNWFGLDTLTAVISDEEFSDSTLLLAAVNPVNDPPFFTAQMPDSIHIISTNSDTLHFSEIYFDIDTPFASLIITKIHSSFISCDIIDSLGYMVVYSEKNIGGLDTLIFSLSDDEFTVIDSIIINVEQVTGIDYLLSLVPEEFNLLQNYPNPFNPDTKILYSIPCICDVKIRIFDIRGCEIITLIDEKKEPKNYQITWDGRDASGNNVSSGLYLYQLIAKSPKRNFIKTKKMVLLE